MRCRPATLIDARERVSASVKAIALMNIAVTITPSATSAPT